MKLSSNLFDRYQQEMRLRNYAPNTTKVYTSVLRAYVAWIGPTHPREASVEQIRAFQLDCIEQGLSPAYLSVPGFKHCLATETRGAAEAWCLPAAQPIACTDNQWWRLQTAGVPSCA